MKGVTPENLPEHPRRWAVAEALDVLEPQAVAVVLDALDPIIRKIAAAVADHGAVQALTAPLTAAAVDELGQILHLWGVAVDDEILPYYRRIFQAGGYSALAQITAGGDPASIVKLPDDYLAEPASRYLATVRRRFDFLGEQAWSKARTVMLEGMDRGQSIDVIAENLRGVTDLTKAQATAVARTHVVGAANAGAYEQALAMPDDTKPRFKQWLSTLDRRTRPTHVDVDGDVVPLADFFEVGDALLEYPGDPHGPDAEVVNCRCTPLFTDNPDGEFDERTPGRQVGGEGGVLQKVAGAVEPDLIDVKTVSSDLKDTARAINEFRQMPRPMMRPGDMEPSAELKAYEEARLRVGERLDEAIRERIGPMPQPGPGPGMWTDWGDVQGTRAWRDAMAEWLPGAQEQKRWIVYYQSEMRLALDELGQPFAFGQDLVLRTSSGQALDDTMREAARRFPKSWINHMNRKPVYATDVGIGRGHYNPETNILAIRPHESMLATHEMTHHAEATVPGLTESEWYLKWSRETRTDQYGRFWEPLESYQAYLPGEVVRPDGWPTRYMGRSYTGTNYAELSPIPYSHYEVMSVANEGWAGDPFSPDWRPYHTEIYEQIGLRRWLLGVLATIR
jgi:hypothetical protein